MEDLFLYDFVKCARPYSKRYCIKKDGSQVFDCLNSKNVQKHKTKDGYIAFNTMITDDGKKTFPLLHNLIASNFIAKPKDLGPKLYVKHIDGNKENNAIENLLWDRRETTNKRVANKAEHRLKNRRVYQYDKNTMNLIRVYKSTSDAARYGFDSSGISRCCNGIYKQHKGFVFSYAKLGENGNAPKQLELALNFD